MAEPAPPTNITIAEYPLGYTAIADGEEDVSGKRYLAIKWDGYARRRIYYRVGTTQDYVWLRYEGGFVYPAEKGDRWWTSACPVVNGYKADLMWIEAFGYNNTLYWYVKVERPDYSWATSPTYSFVTAGPPGGEYPPPTENPTPANGAVDVSKGTTTFSWEISS